jgi:NADH:ubiquinone oxidoreductase subunit F (NADH-binding)
MLTSGPDPRLGPERWSNHQQRLGPLPTPAGLITVLEHSGLRGRGGAAFPVGRKWRSVADRRRGPAVVLANGAEGEPLSLKDRTLLAARPHLVLDGALLAAGAVGAGRIVLYVGEQHDAAGRALQAALSERRLGAASHPVVDLVAAPRGYVSGEESAAVHYLNDGVALPTMRPPLPFERGVDGLPTLVQNVETLAAIALLARGTLPGTMLVTVSGAVAQPGAHEVPAGATLSEVVAQAGGLTQPVQAVLFGGAAGAFMPAARAHDAPLDPGAIPLGAGVVALLPSTQCGVAATAELVTSMAAFSAGQCGPCRAGLPAIAASARRLANGQGDGGEVARLRRWATMVTGRGACHHPDGAAQVLRSALDTFAADFRAHDRGFECTARVPRRRIA